MREKRCRFYLLPQIKTQVSLPKLKHFGMIFPQINKALDATPFLPLAFLSQIRIIKP